MNKSNKNRFYSIKTSSGLVKNFTVFANGDVSVQYIGEKIQTKFLGNIYKQRMEEREVIEIIQKHNQSIDDYINGELAKKLGAKNGKINLGQWFKAQELIKQQGFYSKGIAMLNELRNKGFDVKMDMQSDKLVYKHYR